MNTIPAQRLPALLALGLCAATFSAAAAAPRLAVSANRHFLVHADGRPFFYLGDTAWELFHRLNPEEADRYFTDRARKGFTVIQAVALAEEDGLNTPNFYGHRPLIANDPARPDVKEGPANDYWDHVDTIVEKAASLGLLVGLLPTWGDYDRQPTKPVIDGEPIYEDHPVSFKAADFGHSTATDVRRPLYWNLFTGACGHPYGHHSVWQMWSPRVPPKNNPLLPWFEAIDQPGAGTATLIGEFDHRGAREFQSPDPGENLDWVLVLDDAARNYPPPGTRP